MRASDVLRLYDYSCWANHRLLAVVSQLSPDEFTRHVAGSYESVRNTLVHVLSAEWGWLERCGGYPRGERLKAEDFPSLDAIASVWTRVEHEMRTFIGALADDALAEPITFAIGTGPVMTIPRADLLQHAIVHAVHHRGQLALMLRELGKTPGNFDLLFYAAEQR
jgi:uncharacterized damage-inducible protein DinB